MVIHNANPALSEGNSRCWQSSISKKMMTMNFDGSRWVLRCCCLSFSIFCRDQSTESCKKMEVGSGDCISFRLGAYRLTRKMSTFGFLVGKPWTFEWGSGRGHCYLRLKRMKNSLETYFLLNSNLYINLKSNGERICFISIEKSPLARKRNQQAQHGGHFLACDSKLRSERGDICETAQLRCSKAS